MPKKMSIVNIRLPAYWADSFWQTLGLSICHIDKRMGFRILCGYDFALKYRTRGEDYGGVEIISN